LRPEWCGEGGRKRWKTREECGYIGLCLIAWPTAAGHVMRRAGLAVEAMAMFSFGLR